MKVLRDQTDKQMDPNSIPSLNPSSRVKSTSTAVGDNVGPAEGYAGSPVRG